jgi:hypothetical protein
MMLAVGFDRLMSVLFPIWFVQILWEIVYLFLIINSGIRLGVTNSTFLPFWQSPLYIHFPLPVPSFQTLSIGQ